VSRILIVQRYAQGNWDSVQGLAPFIATGPSFKAWIIPGSLEKHREHRFRIELKQAMVAVFPKTAIHRDFWHRSTIAEFLLREGIVSALWAVNQPECVPRTERWGDSVTWLAKEIHYSEGQDIVDWTIELLSGMSDPAHFHSYVAEDGVVLEPVAIPEP
jgi:hypothetical protein